MSLAIIVMLKMTRIIFASVWCSHQKVPLIQRHKEWSWYLKSEETFVPFWSYDTAPVPEEERKINKLSASGQPRAYWGKKEQTGRERTLFRRFFQCAQFFKVVFNNTRKSGVGHNVFKIAYIWACKLVNLKVHTV